MPPDPDVDALVSTLPPERARLVDRLRALVLAADPAITEGVKWNSPSFRTSEWFATLNLRSAGEVRVILHAGAKARGLDLRTVIADPAGLLEWLGPERAMLRVASASVVDAQEAALLAVVRAWVARV